MPASPIHTQIKLGLGPVGGLAEFGSETDRLVGTLRIKCVRIADFPVPKTNYEKARDEIEIPLEEDIAVHPVSSAREV